MSKIPEIFKAINHAVNTIVGVTQEVAAKPAEALVLEQIGQFCAINSEVTQRDKAAASRLLSIASRFSKADMGPDKVANRQVYNAAVDAAVKCEPRNVVALTLVENKLNIDSEIIELEKIYEKVAGTYENPRDSSGPLNVADANKAMDLYRTILKKYQDNRDYKTNRLLETAFSLTSNIIISYAFNNQRLNDYEREIFKTYRDTGNTMTQDNYVRWNWALDDLIDKAREAGNYKIEMEYAQERTRVEAYRK